MTTHYRLTHIDMSTRLQLATHLLVESGRLICRLESSAYKAIEQYLRVQQADKESSVPTKWDDHWKCISAW